MAISDRQLLDALSRTSFVDSTELALILGEPHATVHRTLSSLLAESRAGWSNGNSSSKDGGNSHICSRSMSRSGIFSAP